MRRTLLNFFSVAIFGLVMLGFASLASAQFRAGVQGTVTDAAGAVVPGATVTLTSKETAKEQQTTTSDQGFYTFSNLAPGSYTLSAELAGFKKQTLENVTINAEAVQGIDIALSAGGVNEVVTITDEAGQQLQTENANVDRAISTEEIRQLPQIGRDPYELARLTPGIFGDGARGGNGNSVSLPNTTGPGGSNSSIFQTENQVPISANGQRVSNNNFQIDGVSVNSLGFGGAAVVTPNQEAVKEVRILSSSYSAEDGRNSGAQIKVVSQNGTNDFHGSAFFKYNSPKLNAFNKFGGINTAPTRINDYIRQFGGSFGGPIYLPRFGEGGPAIYNGENKAFFFVSYEGLRTSVSNTATGYVETAQYRQLVQQQRPNSIAARVFATPGITPRTIGVLSQNCRAFNFDSRCRVVAGGLDLGSLTGAQGQYVSYGNPIGGGFDGIPDVQEVLFELPGSTRGNQFNARLDFTPTEKDTIAISGFATRLNNFGSDAGAAGRPIADLLFKPVNTAATLLYTRIISPTLVNELRANTTRFFDNQVEDSVGTNFGIPRLEIEGLPFDRIRFGARREETSPAIFAQNQFEFSDTLNKVFGNQSYKFGFVYRNEQDNNNLVGGARPVYSFVGPFNFANDAPIFEGINADPNTGRPADAQRYFRTNYYAAFVQDDWKLRPNFTLNLGLRYEYYSPITEKRGRLTNLVLGSQGLSNARIVATDQLFEPDRNNFAPRLGFAYSPKMSGFGDFFDGQNVVVRGGFGISYNRIPNVLFSNTRGNPPLFARYGLCCAGDFDPFFGGRILYGLSSDNSPFNFPVNPVLAQGLDPATGAPRGGPVEIYGAQADTPNSYVYTYSLETQVELFYKLTATLGYQGSAGRKLIRLVNQNFLLPNNPSFSAVFVPQPDVNSSYNALNANLTRRFSQGFQLQANYRFSKSIDQLSYEGPGALTNQTYPQDNRTERGPSDFDVKHFFTLSSLYEIPAFKSGNGFVNHLLGGFLISGIVTARSGLPFTPKVFGETSTPGGATINPVRPSGYRGGGGTDQSVEAFITGSNFPGGGMPFFTVVNQANGFITPPGIGRNSFRGPRYFNIDLSLVKKIYLPRAFRINESSNLELKANFFNAFNIRNVAPLGFFDTGTIVGFYDRFANSGQGQLTNNPNFGRASNGLAGRIIEFQVRFRF